MWIWLCQICFLVECVLKPKLCSADPSILLGLVPMSGTWREDCEGQRETCGSWRQKSQKHFYTISSFQVYICISRISKYQKKHDATHVIMDHKSWSSSSPWPKDQDLLSRWGQAWKLRKFFARQLFFLKHTSLGPIYRTFFPWESSGDNLLFIFFRWTVQHFPHDFFLFHESWVFGAKLQPTKGWVTTSVLLRLAASKATPQFPVSEMMMGGWRHRRRGLSFLL